MEGRGMMNTEYNNGGFDELWRQVLDANLREEYEEADSLVPNLAAKITDPEQLRYLFDRMTIASELDWKVRDAAVATLGIDKITEKVGDYELKDELQGVMEQALVEDEFPWIPANAMNWLLNYTDPDEETRAKIISRFISQAEQRAQNPDEPHADRWTKAVLAEEVSFLPKIPEVAAWLESAV
jgi:hypothetical protein